jgi:hypothetical protein
MRGVDLAIFDFDYDMQWFAMMLTPNGAALGRFGGRDADTPAKYQTLAGLRHSLNAALKTFRNAKAIPGHAMEKGEKARQRKPMRAEDFPAAAKLPDNACIHCHHVNEFRRDLLQREKRWSLDEVWA